MKMVHCVEELDERIESICYLRLKSVRPVLLVSKTTLAPILTEIRVYPVQDSCSNQTINKVYNPNC